MVLRSMTKSKQNYQDWTSEFSLTTLESVFPDYFLDIPEDGLWQLINVNVIAVVMVGVPVYNII